MNYDQRNRWEYPDSHTTDICKLGVSTTEGGAVIVRFQHAGSYEDKYLTAGDAETLQRMLGEALASLGDGFTHVGRKRVA